MSNDIKCAGCGETVYEYRVKPEGRLGLKCCADYGPPRDSALLHQYRDVAGTRMSEMDIRRIRSRRPAPDGSAPTLRRYGTKGDQVR